MLLWSLTLLPQTKWDVGNLHRHPDYAPVKKEPPPQPPQPIETKPKVTHPEPKKVEPQLPEMPSKNTINETPPSDPDFEFGSKFCSRSCSEDSWRY